MKDSRETVERNLLENLALLKEGKFLEAQHRFLADNVKLYEGNNPPKEGKDYCIAEEEKVLAGVGEFIRYEVKDYAVSEGVSFYEGIMEYVEKNGTHVRVDQAVVTHWENGKIISERFYHA